MANLPSVAYFRNTVSAPRPPSTWQQAPRGSDYVKLQELQARQTELEAALEEKTEGWVYLNELKEQIDAQNG